MTLADRIRALPQGHPARRVVEGPDEHADHRRDADYFDRTDNDAAPTRRRTYRDALARASENGGTQ